MRQDPLARWMEMYFVWYQNPTDEEAGWRRYTIEAMMQEYGTRLTGEPEIHDQKAFNAAMRIRPRDPDLCLIIDLLHALPVDQYNALFSKYWYVGAYYAGLIRQPADEPQEPVRKFRDEDRAKKVGQALSTFELNVKRAKEAICPRLGIRFGRKEEAA